MVVGHHLFNDYYARSIGNILAVSGAIFAHRLSCYLIGLGKNGDFLWMSGCRDFYFMDRIHLYC